MGKHIANARSYGVPVVVAINKFETDTEAELKVIEEEALSAGAEAAVPANHWAEGGAGAVEFSEVAQKKVDMYNKTGFGNLPICIAKTQYSLSHDPALKGAPTGFTVPIRDVRLAAGASYLY